MQRHGGFISEAESTGVRPGPEWPSAHLPPPAGTAPTSLMAAIDSLFQSGFADLIPAGIYVIDSQGLIVNYNARAAAVWGRSPRRLDPAVRFTGAYRPCDADGNPVPPDRTPVAQVLRDGIPRGALECINEHPNGSRRNVVVHINPLLDENGRIVGAVNCVQDITERKRAEAEYRTHTSLADAIICNAAESLFMLDGLGRIVFANAAAERVFGYKSTEMLGSNFHELLAVHPTATPTSFELDATFQAREDTFVRKDGSFVPVTYSQSPIRQQGVPVTAVLVVHDISEHKRVQAELTQAKEAAESADRAKDQFLAVLSHELRTPLTPVLTTVQMMERDPLLSDDTREQLTMVRQNVELEARLIDDLLDLTRVARGKLELHVGPADVHEQLRQVIRICDSDLRAKQLELRLDLQSASAHVRADVARLQQILWNLLKNAIKFTPTGGHVTFRTWNEGAANDEQLVVEVSDTGIGIHPDALPRIFNAFEQGGRDVTRMFGGMGLGLAIAHALTELHGGTLTACSEGRGRGATFTLVLPTTDALEQPPAHLGLPHVSSADHPHVRILLVEDHVDTARAMTRLLRGCGYAVRTADTVASALQAAHAEEFDLLISDIGLPDGSGLDLMRQLLARHHIKGIALSGFGMEEDVRQSRDAGFLDHLTKPVDLSLLQAAIAKITPV